MPPLVLYSRPGCHLCEVLVEELLPLIEGRLQLEIRNIDTCDRWRDAYHTRIPVVEYDGELICQYHLDRDAVARLLGDNPK